MDYETQYRETIRLYLIHHDPEIVAKMMNDKGTSYREVTLIISQYRNRQRKSNLLGTLVGFTMGGMIIGLNLFMAAGVNRIFPILTVIGIGFILFGMWSLFRTFVPR